MLEYLFVRTWWGTFIKLFWVQSSHLATLGSILLYIHSCPDLSWEVVEDMLTRSGTPEPSDQSPWSSCWRILTDILSWWPSTEARMFHQRLGSSFRPHSYWGRWNIFQLICLYIVAKKYLHYPVFAKFAQCAIIFRDSCFSFSVYPLRTLGLRLSGSPNTYAISSPCITPVQVGHGEFSVRWPNWYKNILKRDWRSSCFSEIVVIILLFAVLRLG